MVRLGFLLRCFQIRCFLILCLFEEALPSIGLCARIARLKHFSSFANAVIRQRFFLRILGKILVCPICSG